MGLGGYIEQHSDESLVMRNDCRVLAFTVIDIKKDAGHDRIHSESLQGRL